jgi:hypothetical protein
MLTINERRLSGLGFVTISTDDNPAVALAKYKKRKEEGKTPDLVLTDQEMGKDVMLGTKLIAEMRKVKETRFAIYTGDTILENPNDLLWQAQNEGVSIIQKGTGAQALLFDQAISRIFSSLVSGEKTIPAKTQPQPSVDRPPTNPIRDFIGQIVHKVNNVFQVIAATNDWAIELAKAAGSQQVIVDEDFKPGLFNLVALYGELGKFADSQASLGQLATVEESELPKSLLKDGRFAKKVWDIVPPGERFKLAVMAKLYYEYVLSDLIPSLEKYAAAESIEMAEAKKIERIMDILQVRNNAAVQRKAEFIDSPELQERFEPFPELLEKLKASYELSGKFKDCCELLAIGA